MTIVFLLIQFIQTSGGLIYDKKMYQRHFEYQDITLAYVIPDLEVAGVLEIMQGKHHLFSCSFMGIWCLPVKANRLCYVDF